MSKLAEELYALLDAAGFYVDYRSSDESERHRFWIAAPQVRKEVGQPPRRPGQTSPDDDRIQVLEGDVLIVDIVGGVIYVSAFRYCGGFGPGDYRNLWSSAQDVFDDVSALLIERDIRMQAKDVGRQLHPYPKRPMEGESLAFLKESLFSAGFVMNDAFVEARDTAGGESSRQPGLEVNDGGHERIFVFLHPRGFWCVRSFMCEVDRRFGDFEHYWANVNEVFTDVEDFLRRSSLRRRAQNKGIEHMTRSSSASCEE